MKHSYGYYYLKKGRNNSLWYLIVGNITVVIDQWRHLINGFWKLYQRHYYLNWLNKRKTRYVKTNKYQECIWISNNSNMEICVDRFRITYNWKWRAFGFALLCMERLVVVTQHQSMDLKWFCIVGFDCW